jgi:hypothetical protein
MVAVYLTMAATEIVVTVHSLVVKTAEFQQLMQK